MRTACRAGRALYAATTPQPQERLRFEFHWGRQTKGERRKKRDLPGSRSHSSIPRVTGPSISGSIFSPGLFSFRPVFVFLRDASFLPSFLPSSSLLGTPQRKEKKKGSQKPEAGAEHLGISRELPL